MSKNIKHLSKSELMELLLEQVKINEELQSELDAAREELKNKDIIIKEAGSIADASLELNKVFETAQKAADQYLRSIKAMNRMAVMNAIKSMKEREY